jgi:hypothetical protein
MRFPAPKIAISLAASLLLAACGSGDSPAPDGDSTAPADAPTITAQADVGADEPDNGASAKPEDPTPLPAATTPRGDPVVDDPRNLMPAALSPEVERTEKGARNVLLSFARAIEEKQFRVAYALFNPAFRNSMSEAEFAARFADMGRITVAVPGGRMEGAAGSSYYEVPTTITDDRGIKRDGTIVLRRVNDVPGASDYDLKWHVSDFRLN